MEHHAHNTHPDLAMSTSPNATSGVTTSTSNSTTPSSLSHKLTSPASVMSSSVKRACDACHRRKVKCDGISPCRNCSSAQLTCTYHAIPQKKGPKGSRAKVISELRETQRHTTLSSKAARLPCTSNLAPTPGLLTADILKDCVDFYFAHVHATLPMLNRPRVEQQMMYVEQNADAYCLLASMCAFVLLQPGMGTPGDHGGGGMDCMPGSNLMTSTMLVEETIRVRKNYDHTEAPGLNTLCTSYFIYACHHALELHNKAWYHLREATTLALIMGMQKEESYMQCDVVEASQRRRLYWLLFIAERAYALQRQRPMSLAASIALPSTTDDPADTRGAPCLQKFINLTSLYQPFDDSLITLWNKTRNDCSPSYIAALQKQLSDAVPNYLSTHGDIASDLHASQQWLRTMVWQLSMQNKGEDAGQFQYEDVMTMTAQFSRQNMGSQGAELIEKLFSTSCVLTDHLSDSDLPSSSSPSDNGGFTSFGNSHLHQFQTLLSILRAGDTRFLPLLLTKVHDVLPLLANPMLPGVPKALANSADGGVGGLAGEIDIFDGFGNAGLGIPMSSGGCNGFPRITIPPHGHPQQQEYKLEEQLLTPSGTNSESPGTNSGRVQQQQGQGQGQGQPGHAHSQSPAFASPHAQMVSTPLEMDYPHLPEYADAPHPQQGHGHHSFSSMSSFKQEFDVGDLDPLAGLRGAPPAQMRQGSFHGHGHGHGHAHAHAQMPHGRSQHQHQHHHNMQLHHGNGLAMAMNLSGVPSMGHQQMQAPRSVPDYGAMHHGHNGHGHMNGRGHVNLSGKAGGNAGGGGAGGGGGGNATEQALELDFMTLDGYR